MNETKTPHNIPENWVWTSVEQLYDVVGGGTPSTKVPEYWNGDIPWITSADVHSVKDIRPRRYVTNKGIEESATNLVPKESLIIVTRIGLGKVALTKIPICFSQDLQALVGSSSLLNPEYSLYYLSKAAQIFKYKHRGTTIAGVTKKQLITLPFPLPPVSEQVRIVSKLEELFSKLDVALKSLERTKVQLKHYQQSVLRNAFTGKLTQEWRQVHENEIELASRPMERIFEERNINKKYNQTETGIQRESGDLQDIPDSWIWTTVGELYNVVGGGTPSTRVAKYWKGSIPWITSADISDERNISIRRHITEEAIDNSAANLVPKRSILVVTRVGLGKLALTNFPLCYNQDIQALVGKDSLIDPEFSLYYLSKAVQSFKYTSRGTTIAGVPKKQLVELKFPLAPLAEQKIIVDEIERRFSIAEKIAGDIRRDVALTDRLRQSILTRAFEGELVPQDSSDEPASELLERIKKEKSKKKMKELRLV